LPRAGAFLLWGSSDREWPMSTELNTAQNLFLDPLLRARYFHELKTIRGRSPNTILAYRRDLELFELFLALRAPLAGFYDHMAAEGLTVRSQARVVSSLRSYLKFCKGLGYETPELDLLRPPRVVSRIPARSVTNDILIKLLNASVDEENPERTKRNALTIFLLFALGVRVSEMINLNLEDILMDRVLIKNRTKPARELFLSKELAEGLRDYQATARESLRRSDTESVLINDRGHRPSRVDIWRWLSAWSEKAGFSKPVSPKDFRHGCGRELVKKGVDVVLIKEMLGHKYLTTTIDFYQE
jgi:integrase/recombinase XerD